VRDLTRELLARRIPRVEAREAAGRPSAVLLLLYEQGGEDHVLFQVRTSHVLHHKGEISLPGGARDPEDESLLATALRETHEEIGVQPGHVEVFGGLDELTTRSGYTITPYVGAIVDPGPYPFALAPREVDQLLTVPLSHLSDAANHEWSVRELDGVSAAERAFLYEGHRIWGATARIVGGYLDLLTGAMSDSLSPR